MKRIFTLGLMLASVFALTNCTEELVDPTIPKDEITQETTTPEGEGIPFQVYASLGTETKTEGYSDGGVLKTKWQAGDHITVFYSIVGEENITCAGYFGFAKDESGEVKADDVDEGLFSGFLPQGIDASQKYNWYFVYDATKSEAATLSGNETDVTINSSLASAYQTQSEGGSVEHIGGVNCPMWGSALNVTGLLKPRVQMQHLASLYEIVVKNDTKANSASGATPGPIFVYDLGMSVSTTGTWISKHNGVQQALYGDFSLNILNGTLTKKDGNENYEVKLALTNECRIGATSSANFYFVTAPLQIQTNKTADSEWYQQVADPDKLISKEEYDKLQTDAEKKQYKVAIKRQDTFVFKVNGSSRTVPASTDYEFMRGYVYKFTLPVQEMQHPFVSNGLEVWSAGRKGTDTQYDYKGGFLNLQTKYADDLSHKKCKILNFSGSEQFQNKININGTTLDEKSIYKLNANSGEIIIEGFAKDMIMALPIGFYASMYNNQPTAMTIKNINLWVPSYNDSYYSLKYRRPVLHSMGTALSGLMENLGINANGIPRSALTLFIDPSTITFKNIFANNYFDKNNVIMMNQNITHKNMSYQLVNSFLERFAAFRESDQKTIKASYEGLYAILDANISADGTLVYKDFIDANQKTISAADMKQKANDTAYAIYHKIYNTISNKIGNIGGGMFKGMTDELVGSFFTGEEDLKHKLRDMRFKIIIETYPYTDKGTENPILFWGMNYAGTATDYSAHE